MSQADNFTTLGNADLMNLPKTSFLSSRKISPDAVMKSHAWAARVRETDTCVIGGFQSDLEKDVLRFLLRGKCPIVIVEARKPRKIVPAELRPAFGQGRILFVSLSNLTNSRVGETQAMQRNRFILEHSAAHVFGALNPNGCLAKVLGVIGPQANSMKNFWHAGRVHPARSGEV